MKTNKTKWEFRTYKVKNDTRENATQYWKDYQLLKQATTNLAYAYRKFNGKVPDVCQRNVKNAKERFLGTIKKEIKFSLKRADVELTIRESYQLGNASKIAIIKSAKNDIINRLREKRANNRRVSNWNQRVHTEPNYWFNKSLEQAFNPKRPIDDKRYFGIELECMLPTGQENQWKAKLMKYRKYVSAASDGSIQPTSGYFGIEYRILVEKENLKEVVDGVTTVIKEMGGKVNRSCGMHVHFDMRNTTDDVKAKVYRNLYHSLNLIYSILPESRRNNSYCNRNRTADWMEELRSGDRYKAINVQSLARHNTIEIRAFGGTLEAEKIINWIVLLDKIMTGDAILRSPRNFTTMGDKFGIPENVIAWADSRVNQFSTLNVNAPRSEDLAIAA